MKNKFRYCLTLLIICFFHVDLLASHNLKKDTFISDAEIESIMEGWLEELFSAASLTNKPEVYLMVSNTINASSLEGSKFIVLTGLLQKAENVGQIIGVLAHETGHSAKAHHRQWEGKFNQSAIPLFIGTLLGGAAAIASGDGQALLAGMAMGQHIFDRSMCKYSQAHESEADAVAFNLLKKLHWPAEGLTELFKMIEKVSLANSINPYTSTHPVTTERINKLKQTIKDNQYQGHYPTGAIEQFARIQAKLDGFLLTPNEVKRKYDKIDSDKAKYALAIAEYRLGHPDKAIKIIQDNLLVQSPKDPFYLELMGQICFEAGRVEESIEYYEQACANRKYYHILIAYARALCESKNKANLAKAEEMLILANRRGERDDPSVWRLRATINEKLGKTQHRDWCMAEAFMIEDNKSQSKKYAERASKGNNQEVARKARDLLQYDKTATKASA